MTYIITRGPRMHEYRDSYSGNPFGPLPSSGELATAAHESAHAVLAGSIGHEVHSVTVDRGGAGRCHHTGPAGRDAGRRMIDSALVAIAPYAGRDYLEGGVAYEESLSPGDERTIRAALDGMDPGEASAFRRELADTARQKIAAHAAAWRALTYQLLRRSSLDGSDLEAIDPDLFTRWKESATTSSARSTTPRRSAPTTSLPDLRTMSQEQRNRIADALEKLIKAQQRHESRGPTYHAGSNQIETRVNADRLESRDLIPGLRYGGSVAIETIEGRRA